MMVHDVYSVSCCEVPQTIRHYYNTVLIVNSTSYIRCPPTIQYYKYTELVLCSTAVVVHVLNFSTVCVALELQSSWYLSRCQRIINKFVSLQLCTSIGCRNLSAVVRLVSLFGCNVAIRGDLELDAFAFETTPVHHGGTFDTILNLMLCPTNTRMISAF